MVNGQDFSHAHISYSQSNCVWVSFVCIYPTHNLSVTPHTRTHTLSMTKKSSEVLNIKLYTQMNSWNIQLYLLLTGK
jgi:hypothetical protein